MFRSQIGRGLSRAHSNKHHVVLGKRNLFFVLLLLIVMQYIPTILILVISPASTPENENEAPLLLESAQIISGDNEDNIEVVSSADNTHIIKNVIAFSVYGSSEKYWGGALPNAKLALELYPNWTVRFYHDSTLFKVAPKSYIDELQGMLNVEFRDMSNSTIINPMTWRFLAALDPEITGAYIMRDVDSRLSECFSFFVRMSYTIMLFYVRVW